MRRLLFGFLATIASFACAAPPADESPVDDAESEDALTSKDAQIVDDIFRGEVVAAPNEDAKKAIVRQLFYVVGPLTRLDANAQVGRVQLTEVTERIENGKKRITYAARLPVAWPKASRSMTTWNGASRQARRSPCQPSRSKAMRTVRRTRIRGRMHKSSPASTRTAS